MFLSLLPVALKKQALENLRGTSRRCCRPSRVFGGLEGEYRLVFDYRGQQDTYELSVTPSELDLASRGASTLTQADYLLWRRLPPRTVWLVVHDPVAFTDEGGWKLLERRAYEEQKEEFFAELRRLNVTRFTPDEGHCTNYHFTPPWESWHQSKGSRPCRCSPIPSLSSDQLPASRLPRCQKSMTRT